MAITTLDGIIAGMRPPDDFMKVGTTHEAAAVLHSHFYASGNPGAAVAPSPGLAGAALTSYAGQLPFTNPGSGNSYLARLQIASTLSGSAFLVDRLWHNSGIVSATTTAQTVNSVTWPARDRDGSTNGEGIIVGLEVSTATTNGAAINNTTLTYTNQAGTGSRTATMNSFPATAVVGTFVPFQLQAGDTGIRSIQSVTLGTSYGTGVVHLVAYRTLARVDIVSANTGNALDSLTGGFVRLYDNTVPFLLWLPVSTTAISLFGSLTVTQG